MPFTSVSYAANGKYVATGAGGYVAFNDLTARVWRVSDGMVLRTIGFDGWVIAVAFTPDSSTIVAADSLRVDARRISDGKLLMSLKGYAGKLSALAISPDGNTLALGLTDGTVELHNLSDGSLIRSYAAHTSAISSLAFSPDGLMLATGAGKAASGIEDNTAKVWRVSDAILLLTETGPAAINSRRYQVAFSADGLHLLMGSRGDGFVTYPEVWVWRLDTGALLKAFSISRGSSTPMRYMSFSPDGNYVTVTRGDGGGTFSSSGLLVEQYRTSDGQMVWSTSRNGNASWPLAYSADGNTLVITNQIFETEGKPIDLAGISILQSSNGAISNELTPAGETGVRKMAVSPDGSTIATTAEHGYVQLRRGADGSYIRFLPYADRLPYSNIAFSPDSSLISFAHFGDTQEDAWLEVVRVKTGEILRTVKGINVGSGQSCFVPDGQAIVVNSVDTANPNAGSIQMIRISDGALLRELHNTGGIPQYTPDGQTMIILDGRFVLFYKASDWTRLGFGRYDPSSGRISCVSVSPDSKTVALGESDRVDFVDIQSSRLVRTFDSPSPVQAVAFSPDGQAVAVGTQDSRLFFVSAADATVLASYDQETGTGNGGGYATGVNNIAYTADGKSVIYSRYDGMICSALNPYRNAMFPNHGGNTGNVTAKVVTALDFPLAPGATVTLKADGQPDIVGTPINLENPYVLNITFDLRGVPLSKRDVVVTNADGATRIYPQGFTVERGQQQALTTQMIGSLNLRSGSNAKTLLTIVNAGNIDAKITDVRVQFPSRALSMFTDGVISRIDKTDFVTSLSRSLPYVAPGIVSLLLNTQAGHDLDGSNLPMLSWVNDDSDFFVTAIGSDAENLVLRAADKSGDIITVYGMERSGILSEGRAYMRLETPDHHSLIIYLDNEGKPTEFVRSDGVKGSIQWWSADHTVISVEVIFPDGTFYQSGEFNIADPGPFGPIVTLGVDRTPDPAVIAARLAAVQRTFKSISNVFKPIAAVLGFVPQTRLLGLSFGLTAFFLDWLATGSNLRDSLNYIRRHVVVAQDPNDLSGSLGFGPTAWILGSAPVSYLTRFENIPTATAAAQQIIVTGHLDPRLVDVTTVCLGAISIDNKTIIPALNVSLPVGKQEFNADVDLQPAKNLKVHVHASLDMLTGDLTWTFTSIDPATGLPLDPADPNGFLAPGEEGSVVFSVLPKSGLPTGTVVTNQATIVFDANAPMDTNVWSNTVDNDLPVSKVNPLDMVQMSEQFTVNWAGTDIGSGVRDFTIYVSDNYGPFTPWLSNTTDTSATYTGVGGHTYAFYSVARDNTYNIETAHALPDTTTLVMGGGVTDVSSQVTVTRGGYRLNRGTGHFVQTVTLTNTGTALTGPVSLALDTLGANATLFNQTGVTSALTPVGSPYIDVVAGTMAAGASVTVTLEFTDPTKAAINYSTRVLAGTGSR